MTTNVKYGLLASLAVFGGLACLGLKQTGSENPRYTITTGGLGGNDQAVFVLDTVSGKVWELRRRANTKEAAQPPEKYVQDRLFMPVFRASE